MEYVFDINTPPLMKNGDIHTVAPANLQGKIITADPTQPNSPVIYNDSQHDHWQTYSSFIVRSYQVWEIDLPVYLYANDVTTTIEVANGYDKSEANSFSRTISATVGAEGFGLSASVTASLGYTSSQTENWRESTTKTTTETFKANVRYVNWILYDVIEVEAQGWYQYEHRGDNPPGYTKQGDPATSMVKIVNSLYSDSQ